MTNLTEKWKNGELETGDYYYIKINDKIIPARLSKYGNFYLTEGACGRNAMRKVKQILAPVPSYAEWQSLNELVDCMSDTGKAFAHMLYPFTDDYFNGLTTKDIAELAKKSIRLTTQHCEDNAEIDKLKQLLKECRDVAEFTKTIVNKHKWFDEVITKIDEVLK